MPRKVNDPPPWRSPMFTQFPIAEMYHKDLRARMDAQDEAVAEFQGRDEPNYGLAATGYIYVFCPSGFGVGAYVENTVTKERFDVSLLDL